MDRKDTVSSFIKRGLTNEAVSLWNTGANPNEVDEDGHLLIHTAISYGNEVVLQTLLQCGAYISNGRHADSDAFVRKVFGQPRSTLVVLAFVTLVILQFYLPPATPDALHFFVLSIQVENIFNAIICDVSTLLPHQYNLWSIAVIYVPLHCLSRSSYFEGRVLQRFVLACLRSKSVLAYVSRRLVQGVVTEMVQPALKALKQPDVQAILALTCFKGNGEEMALLLFHYELDLGRPKSGEGRFELLWEWAIYHGHVQVTKILISKHPGLDLLNLELNAAEETQPQRPTHLLSFCFLKGYFDIAHILLQHHASLHPAVFYDKTQLNEALVTCLSQRRPHTDAETRMISRLLHYGADANATCSNARSALSWTCNHFVDQQLVSLLLDNGAGLTINSADSNGQTVLHHAASKHSDTLLPTLEVLLDAGADVNTIDKFGHTPLWWAVSRSDLKEVELLLKRGAKVDLRGKIELDGSAEGVRGRMSSTPLTEACNRRSEESLVIIPLLLARGADINAHTHHTTHLLTAFNRKYDPAAKNIVTMLLKEGAHPVLSFNSPYQPLAASVKCTADAGEWTLEVLEAARTFNSGEIPQAVLDAAMEMALRNTPRIYLDGLLALVAEGANPNRRTQHPSLFGGTVLHCVARSEVDFRGSTADTILLLVENGADALALDNAGETPLEVAIDLENTAAVEELIAQGALPDGPPEAGTPPIYTGVQHDYWDWLDSELISAVLKLSVAGVDPESTADAGPVDVTLGDDEGMTPLHIACKWGDPSTTAIILKTQSFPKPTYNSQTTYSLRQLISACDSEGRTPLHWAAHSGSVDIIKMILAANLLRSFTNESEETEELDKQCPFHAAHDRHTVYARDSQGYTPLHHAVKEGNTSVVKLLLEEVEVFDDDLYRDEVLLLSLAEGNHEMQTMLVSRPKLFSKQFENYHRKCDFSAGYYPCKVECRWCT